VSELHMRICCLSSDTTCFICWCHKIFNNSTIFCQDSSSGLRCVSYVFQIFFSMYAVLLCCVL